MFDIKEKFLKKKADYLNHIVYPVSTHGILNLKKKKKSKDCTNSAIKKSFHEGIVEISDRWRNLKLSVTNTQFLQHVGTGNQDSFKPSESSILSALSNLCGVPSLSL